LTNISIDFDVKLTYSPEIAMGALIKYKKGPQITADLSCTY
jgi:hypothetical protein